MESSNVSSIKENRKLTFPHRLLKIVSFPETEEEIKENSEEDTKNYLTLAMNFYEEEPKAARKKEEEKHKNLLIAAANTFN